MMKIAVIGANGKAGKLIANEAVKRGFDVTAIVRSENQFPKKVAQLHLVAPVLDAEGLPEGDNYL